MTFTRHQRWALAAARAPIALCLLAAFLVSAPLAAATTAPALAPAPAPPSRTVDTLPHDAVPEHEAVAARTLIRDDEGEPWAWIHSYAYLKPAPEPDRPVTFFFNGGPGASAALLHVSVGGPIRADLAADGALEPNLYSLLDQTDVVFVDPVGTGFSHAAGTYRDADLWGVAPDTASMTTFVREFMEYLDRPHAPVFLCGESYGAMRAAFMLEPLQTAEPPIDVRGIIFISPAMTTESFVPGQSGVNTLADRLPTYAAIAHEADLINARGRSLIEVVNEAYEFAQGDYRRAISNVRALSRARTERLARYLSGLTGIDASALVASSLSVLPPQMSIARGDPMGTRLDQHDGRRFVPFTQALGGVEVEILQAALSEHLARTWGIDASDGYALFAMRANQAWRRSDGRSHIFTERIELAPLIADAQARNPDLHLFIATGYFDIVTPFGVPRRLLEEGQLDPERTTLREYVGGHMVYVDRPEFERLHRDLHAFFRAQLAAPVRAGP